MAIETTESMTPQQREQVRSLVPQMMQTIHANDRRVANLLQMNRDLLAICEGRADRDTFDRYWPQLTSEMTEEPDFDADFDLNDFE